MNPFADELIRRLDELNGRWIADSPTEQIYVYTATDIAEWIDAVAAASATTEKGQ